MPHFISIVKALDLTTPALLFPAISLLLLAYTNRFLSYASVVRNLKDKYENNPKLAPKSREQINNLVYRLHLTRWMQTLGASSLGLSVIAMFFIYIGWGVTAHILFGIGMLMLFASLVLCIWEIQCSVKAIELHIGQLPKSHLLGDVLASDAQTRQRSIAEAQEKRSQEQSKITQSGKRKQPTQNKGKTKADTTPKITADVVKERGEGKVEEIPATISKKSEDKAPKIIEPKVTDLPKPEVVPTEPKEVEQNQRVAHRIRGRGPARSRTEQAILPPEASASVIVASTVVPSMNQSEASTKADEEPAEVDVIELSGAVIVESAETEQKIITEQGRDERKPRRIRSRRPEPKLEADVEGGVEQTTSDALGVEASSETMQAGLLDAEEFAIEISADLSATEMRLRRRRPRSNRVVLLDLAELESEPTGSDAEVLVSVEEAPTSELESEPTGSDAEVLVSVEEAPISESESDPTASDAEVVVSVEEAPTSEPESDPTASDAEVVVSVEEAPISDQESDPTASDAEVLVSVEEAPTSEPESDPTGSDAEVVVSVEEAPTSESESDPTGSDAEVVVGVAEAPISDQESDPTASDAEVLVSVEEAPTSEPESEEFIVPSAFAPIVNELRGELNRILNK